MASPNVLRTALFVPGTRPERFGKALASGADVAIIDLEDAVERAAKDIARANVLSFASAHADTSFWIRVNGVGTPWFDADLELCSRLSNVSGVMLPKVESAEQVAIAAESERAVFPIIESARGLAGLTEIADAPRVGRLVLGTLDLLLDLGVTPETDAATTLLNDARCRVLLHSRASGLSAPIDGVHAAIADSDGLAAAARLACDMGFAGMLCIHPSQIGIVHRAFAPSAEELAWANRVVQAADASKSFAFKLDGQMVDLPVIAHARRIVAHADA